MTWALFRGYMRKQLKERPPPSLADLQGAPPMGPFRETTAYKTSFYEHKVCIYNTKFVLP